VALWIARPSWAGTDQLSLIVSALSLLLALAVVLVGPLRKIAVGLFDRVLILLGSTRRAYAHWFLKEHGKLRNVYLDRTEELSLVSTYVPLNVYAEGHPDRIPATRVLADPQQTRVLIIGDPGSGKSTLLKAYGTGLLRAGRGDQGGDAADLKAVVHSREVPFLVPLRHLARYLEGGDGGRARGLAGYLTDELLERRAHVKRARAERYIRRLLLRDRCLVLLDGLDEVPDGRYAAVRDAVIAFMTDESQALPTARARIVLSCRRQNFLHLSGDWIPRFAPSSCSLAPLHDTEILAFVKRRSREFEPPRSPEAFFTSVLHSGTVDLHRVPLILTISLGLYLRLTAYQIPRSLGKFYEEMIKELLRRHDFRLDPSLGGANRFDSDDKYRFLRVFALAMARRPEQFEDFGYEAVVASARSLSASMARVAAAEADAFVKEIIDHSGLLVRASDEDEFIFSHRSIHEYFTAVQLQREPRAGAELLWDVADDHEWRQVIMFFAALDHEYVEGFLDGLRRRNLELAGHCIAGAGPVPDTLALEIIDELVARIRKEDAVQVNLPALLSITRSARDPVRATALQRVVDVLGTLLDRPDLGQFLDLDTEGVLRLLDALAGSGFPDLVALVPVLATLLPAGDLRVTGPLWKGLATAALGSSRDVAWPVVDRLLPLTFSEPGLAELQRQPGFEPPFASDAARRRVYPFERGVGLHSNLVTLLVWLDQIGLEPSHLNLFLRARAEDESAFRSVERDRRRRMLAVQPYPLGLLLSTGALAGSLYVIVHAVLAQGWRSVLLTSGPAWLSLLYLLPGVASMIIAGFVARATLVNTRPETITDRQPGVLRRYNRRAPLGLNYLSEPLRSGNPIALMVDDAIDYIYASGTLGFDWAVKGWLALSPALAALAVAVRLLLSATSLPVYLCVATAGTWVAFWLPATDMFDADTRVHLRRPNKCVAIYEDPLSRHWVTAPG